MKERCHTFLIELLAQVEKRIPPDQTIFQRLSALHPNQVLSQMTRLPFGSLPFQHLIGDVSTVEDQYRRVILVNWTEESIFNGTIPNSSVTFWSGVLRYTNSANVQPFRDLAEYCLSCLSMPVSNAVVERTFSVVSTVKTKTRNRMQLRTLEAIVRIRSHLSQKSACCREFQVTKNMLQRFTSDMYTTTTDADTGRTDEETLDLGRLQL
jgi:hypothetical protein